MLNQAHPAIQARLNHVQQVNLVSLEGKLEGGGVAHRPGADVPNGVNCFDIHGDSSFGCQGYFTSLIVKVLNQRNK